MSFVHLHVHSHYSLLDGFGTPEEIVKTAKEQGSPAVAITDHGVLYGAIEFYKAAKKHGIKPIIGCEMYVAPGSRFDRTAGPENKPYHLTLLAINTTGYYNLLTLVSKAHIEGFYYKPRVDYGLLKTYSEGLVALSGCLAGHMARTVLERKEEDQEEVIRIYQDIFGKDNFFLELQDHPFLDDQKILNDRLIELGKKYNVPLIATHDSHYVHAEDQQAQDILLCIQTQATLGDEGRMKFDGDFSLRTPESMQQSFAHVPEAIESTLKIAERANIEIEFGQNLIPTFKTPNNEPAQDYLRMLCEEGLQQKYQNDPSEKAQKQLEYELGVVDRMGFNDYFLIVWDFVKFAKDRGITVGPGRGSAAGSLITYCLDITELDPLQYGLIFERFLNPERISMPDIDIDFADTRRDEVLDYVREKYGRENVAQIITFGTMAARAAVRDVGRAMGYPYAEVDAIAKLIPPPIQGRHTPLAQSTAKDPELKKVYETNPRSKALLDNAIKLEGTVRHAGTHASAVVMSEKPLVCYTPLQKSTGGGEEIITQYSMKITEELGLLKVDFLGLKNLTIIQNTLELLHKAKGLDINLPEISMNDPLAFALLQRGETTGVFQLESGGMRSYIRELKPDSFQDIIAMIALYRPGPMPWIPGYIKAKHNPDTVKYLHPALKSILKETNGVAIYQEQILQIAREIAGFTLGEADILRKAVGKKDPKLLQEQRTKFLEGAVKQGHKQSMAEDIFTKIIEPFAGYGFNKAHAACYAMISYRTAYLKANYPTYFMAALLSAEHGNTDRVVLEMNECEEMGIAVLPPSVNESFGSFTVVDEKTIRFGMGAIKGLGEGTVEEIFKARGTKKFSTLTDFLERVPYKIINKKTLEALAYSGALDDLGERKALALGWEVMAQFAKTVQESSSQGQMNLFGAMSDHPDVAMTFNLPEVPPASTLERLSWEKQYLGLYVSSHPLKGLRRYFRKKVHVIESLSKKNVGKKLQIGGLITRIKKVFTKTGNHMLYGEVEDPTGRLEFVVFPKVYQQFQSKFREDAIVVMEGKLELRGGNFQFSSEHVKEVSLESMIINAQEAGLYDEQEKVVRQQKKLVLEEPVVIGHESLLESVVEGSTMVGTEKGSISEGVDGIVVSTSRPEEWKANPYIINLPLGVETEILQKLKKVLLAHPGDRLVELHLQENGQQRRIKVPFTIHLSEELEKAVKEVVKS